MLRILPHTVPRVGRSYEQFLDGFKFHLLPFRFGRNFDTSRASLPAMRISVQPLHTQQLTSPCSLLGLNRLQDEGSTGLNRLQDRLVNMLE